MFKDIKEMEKQRETEGLQFWRGENRLEFS